LPSTTGELARTRGLGHQLVEGAAGAALLRAVKRGIEVPEEDCPEPRLKPALPRGLGPVIELLKVLMKMKCEEKGVAQKLLASSADIELIAAYGKKAQVPAMHGWRLQVFGEEALKLRRGDTALAIKGKKLVLLDKEAGPNS
jgi:ribonuclease D